MINGMRVSFIEKLYFINVALFNQYKHWYNINMAELFMQNEAIMACWNDNVHPVLKFSYCLYQSLHALVEQTQADYNNV